MSGLDSGTRVEFGEMRLFRSSGFSCTCNAVVHWCPVLDDQQMHKFCPAHSTWLYLTAAELPAPLSLVLTHFPIGSRPPKRLHPHHQVYLHRQSHAVALRSPSARRAAARDLGKQRASEIKTETVLAVRSLGTSNRIQP